MPGLSVWKNSIFGRLFITFILVMVPIFILGLSIYNWGLNSIKYEIVSSMQNKISSSRESLENEIQRIKVLQYNMFYDTSLFKLALSPYKLSNYDFNMELLRVQQRLDAIKTSSKYIGEIYVHVPSIEKSIGTITVGDLNEDDLRLISAYPDLPKNGFNDWEDRILLNLEYPEADLKVKGLPTFFVEVEFSEQGLQSILQEMQVYNSSGAFLMSNGDNIFVYKGSDENVGIDVKNQVRKNNTFSMPGSKNQTFTITINNRRYIVAYSKSSIYDFSLVMYTPEDIVFNKVIQYKMLFIFFVIVSMVIIIIFSFSTYRFIHRPLSNLNNAFGKIEKGDMSVEISHKGKDEFGFIYRRLNMMVRNLNSLIEQVYMQRILVQRAELKQLQAQINPHFLYNSFFTLQRWLNLGYIGDSIEFAQQLGEYFRFVTRSSANEIPLHLEVGHARTYSGIQAIRFSNRIKLDFQDIPKEFENIMVPRLIIQPVIENSFEHALEGREKDGILSVGFQKEGDFLRIIIEDNGGTINGFKLREMTEMLDKDDMNMEITGVINIHRRIRLKFGSNSGVILSIGELGGLKVTLNIEIKQYYE